ncbi:hypothetical protein EI94DRAFT_1789579 [Lactarius quietus]|nr:hypothetical protein EI94DRAFT_1789579 [Lactarius quietus]
MIIVDKSRSRFPNLAGGYEILRKDRAEVTHCFPSFSPEYWDARTVYIRAILNSSPVQHILFPPHHQDSLDTSRKCKCFALVTFNDPTIVSDLLSSFPYDRNNAQPPTDSSIEESETHKAGFGALSKERWDVLQAEYVEYRESVLRRMAVDAITTPNPTPNAYSAPVEPDRASGPGVVPTVNPPSYPPGPVAFALYVSPDTNKTALHTLFSALLANLSALDYIDYTKGLEMLFLLTAPKRAQRLWKRHGLSRATRRVFKIWSWSCWRDDGRRCIERTYPRRKDVPRVGQDGNGDERRQCGPWQWDQEAQTSTANVLWYLGLVYYDRRNCR